MSYLADYDWDIFVSYSRRDDLPMREGLRGWVSVLVEALQGAIVGLLGEPIRVHFDRSPAGSPDSSLDQTLDAARNSALILILGSPSYLRREWTLYELEAFLRAQPGLGRVLVAEYLPLGRDEAYPPAIEQMNRCEFWKFLPGTELASSLRPGTEGFHRQLLDLAVAIERRLRDLRQLSAAPVPGKAPDRAAVRAPGTAAPKPRIFLSYSSKDRDRIEPLARLLEEAGHDIWWDPHIETGMAYRKVITKELERADIVLVVWSLNSVDAEWVHDEAEYGKRHGRLRPVRIDAVEPPIGFRGYQTLDISRWEQGGDPETIRRLLAELR